MSIETRQSLGRIFCSFDGSLDVCFYCGKEVEGDGPFVFWMGQVELVLHPACADDMAAHLMLDTARLRLGDRP